MLSLQEVLDKCTDYECYLRNEIYVGPLVINRPIKIYGNGAIVICHKESDIIVQSDNVEMNDLYIEYDINEICDRPIVKCLHNTIFNNVIVRGPVEMGSVIDSDFDCPSVFDLGVFKSDSENTFSLEIDISHDCILKCTTDCIKVSESKLKAGKNIIDITIGKIRNNVTIYTKLLLCGVVSREIIICGVADEDAGIHNASYLLGYDRNENTLKGSSQINELPPDLKQNCLAVLKKGQRFEINSLSSEVKLQLAYDELTKEIDLDGYLFMLDDTGKATKDSNLVFWGNETSDDGAVAFYNNGHDSYFSVMLNKISKQIKKIAVCYSVYGDNPCETFSNVIKPYIRIIIDGIEINRFYITELTGEKTIVAIELYIYKDRWRINCIGSGYRDGLKKLCEIYGIEVID